MQLPFEYASAFTIMQMFYVASKVDNSQNVQLFFSVAKVNGEKPESNRRNRKKKY